MAEAGAIATLTLLGPVCFVFLLILLWLYITIRHMKGNGEFGQFLSFMKMMKTSQEDLFDGEGRDLRAQIDVNEVTLHIRSMMDLW